MYELFQKVLQHKNSIDLVSSNGTLVKVVKSKKIEGKFQISKVVTGELSACVVHGWEAVVAELGDIEKEHGSLISWSNPKANEVKSPEKEMAEVILAKHMLRPNSKKEDLKSINLVKAYCHQYRKQYGLTAKEVSVFVELQSMIA